MLEVNAEERLQLKKSGQTFLGILNDIKRRPEDAASELGVTTNEINYYPFKLLIFSTEIEPKFL